jgi:hypothetical protein
MTGFSTDDDPFLQDPALFAKMLDATPSFTCPTCALISYNVNDIANRYCANCHRSFPAPRWEDVDRALAAAVHEGDPATTIDPPLLTGGMVTGPAKLDPRMFLIDNPQAFTSTFKFNETPWFPFVITLGSDPPITITLTADGKWEGSITALREHMASAKSIGADGTMRVLLWLLLRQMESDARFW